MNSIRKFRGPMESPINSGGQFMMLPEIIHDGLSQENTMEPWILRIYSESSCKSVLDVKRI